MATSYPGAIDAFNNPTANTAEDATGYEHDLQHANVNDAVEAIETELGTNPSGTYSTVAERLSNTKPKEAIWTPVGTPVWADEFDGESLDSNWVRADYAGDAGHLQWIQSNGVLAAQHNSTADAASGRMHALLYPLSNAGGALSAGDAVVSAWQTSVPYATNYAMVGAGFTDGVTHGTSNIIQGHAYNESGVAILKYRINANPTMQGDLSTGTQVQLSPAGINPLFSRLVMTSANNWRLDYSSDGVGWVVGAQSYAYTITPTHIGFFVSNWTVSTAFAASFKFIRRYSGVS